ncbi:MAG: SycD/LcrH family type III secretion system chaperone [Desulfovibrionaceae bacterium]|nr:SycD/LcrH family type III secretion system chaperone [Desulfovibrionaceae bacterium]
MPGPDFESIKLQTENVYKTLVELANQLGFSEDQIDDVRTALLGDEPLYRIRGLKESLIEGRYALAYQLYSMHKYAEAEELFRWLCIYNAPYPPNWMALGACRQARGKFQEAMDAYQLAAIYGTLQDPAPFYYCGVCSIKLGQHDAAIAALEAAICIADPENLEHKTIADRAKVLLAAHTDGEEKD